MAGLSVHYDCLSAVKAKLLSKTFADANGTLLGVAGATLPASHVQIGMLPRVRQQVKRLPLILVCPVGAEMEFGTLLSTDDIGYPVAVIVVAAGNQDFTTNLETYLAWRQIIYRAFRNQRLSGVPGVFRTKTYPDVVVDPEAFNADYFYSALLFRFLSREPRG